MTDNFMKIKDVSYSLYDKLLKEAEGYFLNKYISFQQGSKKRVGKITKILNIVVGPEGIEKFVCSVVMVKVYNNKIDESDEEILVFTGYNDTFIFDVFNDSELARVLAIL